MTKGCDGCSFVDRNNFVSKTKLICHFTYVISTKVFEILLYGFYHYIKSYLSTLAVLQLDAILVGAKKVYISKTKKNNKNQEPFERMMIMEYELIGIGKVKMTVGIRRRTKEKVQYCITAISGI